MTISPNRTPARFALYPPGTRYILPAALLSRYGLWEYVPVDLEQARRWIEQGPVALALPWPYQVAALQVLVDVTPSLIQAMEEPYLPPPVLHTMLHVGDEALVFQFDCDTYDGLPLAQRMDAASVRIRLEGELYTLGLLRHIV